MSDMKSFIANMYLVVMKLHEVNSLTVLSLVHKICVVFKLKKTDKNTELN